MFKKRKKMIDIKDKLLNILKPESIVENASMADYSSFRAGGKASFLVMPESESRFADTLNLLSSEDIEYFVLGNGSNILISDKGYDGVIVKTSKAFSDIKVDGEYICAGAGALLSAVSKKALENSLTGMEFASGIPGSVGGGAFMNAGAYGMEMKDIITEVKLLSRDGKQIFFKDVSEMDYGYRHSVLYDTGDVVLGVKLKLEKGDSLKIKLLMDELMNRRNSRQPVNYYSAGSFFKRPKGHFAGKLIQDAGLKGTRVGDAEVSMLHGGFIINKGNATATDIIRLMHIVQAKVMDEFGIMLEPEVRIIGE